MPSQLAWIGLGNMGRVNPPNLLIRLSFAHTRQGYVQEFGREGPSRQATYHLQSHTKASRRSRRKVTSWEIDDCIKPRRSCVQSRHRFHLSRRRCCYQRYNSRRGKGRREEQDLRRLLYCSSRYYKHVSQMHPRSGRGNGSLSRYDAGSLPIIFFAH